MTSQLIIKNKEQFFIFSSLLQVSPSLIPFLIIKKIRQSYGLSYFFICSWYPDVWMHLETVRIGFDISLESDWSVPVSALPVGSC